MTTDSLPRIDGVGAPAAPTLQPAPSSPEHSTFQRLLESLRQLRTTGTTVGETENPEQLRDALRAADDGFVTAMDLRKRLEEAFRGRLP